MIEASWLCMCDVAAQSNGCCATISRYRGERAKTPISTFGRGSGGIVTCQTRAPKMRRHFSTVSTDGNGMASVRSSVSSDIVDRRLSVDGG